MYFSLYSIKPKSKLRPAAAVSLLRSLLGKNQFNNNDAEIFQIEQASLSEDKWHFSGTFVKKLKEKIEYKTNPLSMYFDVGQGMTTGLNEAYVVEQNLIKKLNLVRKRKKVFLKKLVS